MSCDSTVTNESQRFGGTLDLVHDASAAGRDQIERCSLAGVLAKDISRLSPKPSSGPLGRICEHIQGTESRLGRSDLACNES
jgi:hypothetical protein